MLQRGTVLDVETPRDARVQCRQGYTRNGLWRFAPVRGEGVAEREGYNGAERTEVSGCKVGVSLCMLSSVCIASHVVRMPVSVALRGPARPDERGCSPHHASVCVRVQEKGKNAQAHDSARLPSGVG